VNRRILLTSLVVLGCLAGCRTADPVAPPVDAPIRLVSLSPAITQTVAAIGAGENLVGRSDWCAYPPEVQSLPALGSALTPNLEAIAGLQPTAVLVDASVANRTDDL
jgi:iron complex transport system substrate-binding protein